MEILNFMKTIFADRCHFSSFFSFHPPFSRPSYPFFTSLTLTSSLARSSKLTTPTGFSPSITAASVARAARIFFIML